MLNAGEMREGPDQRRCFCVLSSHGCSACAQVLRLRGSGLQVNERTPSCRGRRGGRAATGRFWMATWADREACFHRCAGLRVRLILIAFLMLAGVSRRQYRGLLIGIRSSVFALIGVR